MTSKKPVKILVGDPANTWARVLVDLADFEAGRLVKGVRGPLSAAGAGLLPVEWDRVLVTSTVDYAVFSGTRLIAWHTTADEWFVPDVDYGGRSWVHQSIVLWALTTAGEEPVRRVGLSRAEEFFAAHAPTSHIPHEETPEAGRARCARALARAERWAVEAGLSVSWVRDHEAERVAADGQPLWLATLVGEGEGDERLTYTSLGGVEFADGGGPEGDPYARVVGAELALEWFEGEML